jgi:single-stranded-DNA-specific exonuclease
MSALTIRPRARSEAVYAGALRQGYTPLQAQVLAGRLSDAHASDVRRQVLPPVADLDAPDSLPDIEAATDRIVYAITHGEHLTGVFDHDADGSSAGAIISSALIDIFGVPRERVSTYLSLRLTEGYGISDALVDRMLSDMPDGHRSVIISADQGSTDEARIARLKSHGHSFVVSDHHGVPEEGPPKSAFACVNPVRTDSRFPDRAIAGCHTAWLMMASVRQALIQRGHLRADAPKLASYLDLDALGTQADCVEISNSRNNRFVITRGLQLINSNPRPCWQALRELTQLKGEWDEQALSFVAAPRINARGRIASAVESMRFFLSPDLDTARHLLAELDRNNTERKAIQAAMVEQAIPMAREAQDAGASGIVLWFEKGSPGVHGIVASRIVELTGCPTISLSPFNHSDEIVTGSVRSIPGVHARNVLAAIQAEDPTCLIGAGGHAGAAGLRVKRENIERLRVAWNRHVGLALNQQRPMPTLMTDGGLPEAPTLDHVDQLRALAPYGRGFELPVFSQALRVLKVDAIGSDKTHLRLTVMPDGEGKPLNAIWFGAVTPGQPAPVRPGERAVFAFELDQNTFRDQVSLQLRIKAMAA